MAATSTPRGWLEHPESLIGSVLGSRYRITSIIGRGPMGIACEGESSRGRQVTLKLLPRSPELPLEHFAWQVRQALALAHFEHPNVGAINDFGALDDGSAFVSRGRVPGVTLRTILRQGGLPMRRSLEIARQMASVLATAHSQDIAHGRLKPENVIVQGGAGPGDVVKVVDFGMADLPVNLRAVSPNEADARRLALRTRLYLPADVLGASPAIDVYSLGVILFEMIAGQPPFLFESLPPPGPQGPPRTFAECNPSLSVPASVNELVLALLHPHALEHGLNAERAGHILDALLGRPSLPAVEPVTAQMPSALPREPMPGSNPAPARRQPPPPPSQRAPTGPVLVWPTSPPPPPAGPASFPPLPPGFSASTFPPPALAQRAPDVPSPQSSQRLGASHYPPGPPPFAGRPPAQQSFDGPFSNSSFAPPSLVPSPIASDDADAELRPSFIGRLKRLFSKKRPPGF